MKRFLFSMLIGISLSTAGAVVLARMLLPPTVWEEAGGGAGSSGGVAQSKERSQLDAGSDSSASFTQAAAIEVVAARLGTSPKADQLRQTLRANAKVEYHSPQHWTVRLHEASWTAHGSGARYAEPDNDPARVFEHEATGP